MKIILLLIILIPSVLLAQKENQFLTMTKGVFIEQNSKGQFGIVNSKGEVLVPIENELIRECVPGGGFIVYEKITMDGPDYKEGVLRFYDENVKDNLKRTFTRISAVGDDYLFCYDNNLCGVFDHSGATIIPVCLNQVSWCEGNVFWFEAQSSLRSSMQQILTSKVIQEDQAPQNISLGEMDGNNVFQGVFNATGNLLCKAEMRIVEIINRSGESSLFSVQNQNQFIEHDESTRFAIMNGKGEMLSDYIYEEVLNIDGQIVGEIESNGDLKRINIGYDGLPKK